MELNEYDTIARLEATHWWYVGQRRIAENFVRVLGLPPSAQILDAGCGVGGGLKWLSAFGVTTGIDLHPSAVRYSAQTSRRVGCASISAVPFPSDTFDLVTSFEVIYHLAVTNDVAALRELTRVLKPGGWLLLRVPAHDWLRGAHDQQVHTRHRYAKRELAEKIKAAGLQLRRLTYVGFTFFPLALVSRLTEPKDAPHTDVTLPAPFINAVLTRMLTLEGAWLQHFDSPLGLSLLALTQKTC